MKRGAVIGLVAGVAAVAVIGAGVLWWATSRPPAAEDAARAYLDALAAGDLDTVLAMRADRAGDDDEQISAAFRGASALLTDPHLQAVDADGDRARVAASALFADERVDLQIDLVREGDRWRLEDGYLGALEVQTSLGDSVWVGGALIDADGEPVALLPAVYPVAAAPFGVLDGSREVAVAGSVATVLIEASFSPAATGLAQQQLDAYADDCAAVTNGVPENCGLRVPWAADLSELASITYRVDAYPTLVLDADGRSFTATDGVIVATAVGTPREGAERTFTYRADDWALRGDLVLHANALSLAVY